MKLATRLTLSLILPSVLLIGTFAYIDEQRTREHLREELRREGRVIARTVQIALEDALRDRNFEDVRELMDQITGFERVYGLRLFSTDGRLFYQSKILEDQPFLSTDVLDTVLRTRQPGERQRLIQGQQILSYIVPLSAPDSSLYGALQLLQLESFVSEEVTAARNAIFVLTIILIAVTGMVIVAVTHVVVGRPVADFVFRIRSMGPDDRGARVPVTGVDELARLAREFNALWQRLAESHERLEAAREDQRQAELRLKNAERLAALGQLAAGLAHEIGTPLNVIGGRTDALIRRANTDPPTERHLRIIAEQINRIARIVREMLEFAQVKEINPTAVDLRELLGSILEFVDHRTGNGGIGVDWDVPTDLPPLAADRDQIYEVFLNLVLNALDSMTSGGRLTLQAARVMRTPLEKDRAPAEFVATRIVDTGSGIEPSDLGRIFDPFFTTKAVGKGSGLGLSVAYGIVREHGGWIEVQSRPGQGTEITVLLPIRSLESTELPSQPLEARS